MGSGRQLGDQCNRKAYILQNHLCHSHQDQHNNPTYPTRNSYRRRSDERPVTDRTSRTVAQATSQARASTNQRPVANPSRATSSAEPSQPNPPRQQPTSSSPQPQTPPETPDHRSHATPEPPEWMPLHTPTPTQAPDHRSHTTPEPPEWMPLHGHTTTQASNGGRSLRSRNLPTPPASDQSEDEVPLHTHLPTSTNTPRHPSTTGSSSTVSTNIPYYNRLTPPLSPSSLHRSILRKATVHLYDLLHRLQLARECPNAEPLGPDWFEPTSIPGGPTIFDIIVDMLHGYVELRYLYDFPDGMAKKLLRAGCEESDEGQRFREGLRVWMRRGGTVNEEAVASFGLED